MAIDYKSLEQSGRMDYLRSGQMGRDLFAQNTAANPNAFGMVSILNPTTGQVETKPRHLMNFPGQSWGPTSTGGFQQPMPLTTGGPRSALADYGSSAMSGTMPQITGQQSTQLPISLSSPMARLNTAQQNRIGQGLTDLQRINQSQANTAVQSLIQPAMAGIQQGYNSLQANAGLQDLMNQMGYANQMQQIQMGANQSNSMLMQQLIGPMMGAMMQQGGF